MLYACFDLLRPDVVMELSWHNGLNDFYVPYQVQIQRQTLEKVRVRRHFSTGKLN